jgi:asparagine synthase (glutamine-hydrolysing)
MCGIAGFFDLRPTNEPERRARVEAMLAPIRHRGPDGRGVFVEGPVGLGSQRLAIVDVAGGHQPIVHEGVALVCNGEIYDHAQVRERAGGYPSTSGSDVEVLAWLYAERGEGLLEGLEAQAAVALYDRKRRGLLLARDGWGVAPLYWARLPGGGVVFGSEVKALLAHPDITARLDVAGVDQVFAFPGLVSPRTAFAGVQSLRPGHLLWVDADGVRERRWWDLDWPTEGTPYEERDDEAWASDLIGALERAVRRRMMGEVPVGCYLSGGLDSSLLLSLCAAQDRASSRDCFSIGFARGAVDERAHQRRVVEATGARHHVTELALEDISSDFARMIRHAECPVKESYNVASLRLAESAQAAGVKVVLSGEGADELFAGYPGYRVDAHAARSAPSHDDFGALREEDLRAQVFGARGVYYEGQLDAARELRRGLYADWVQEEFERFDCLELDAPLVDGARLRGRARLHQRAYLDVKLRLSDHLLSDHGDRMSMAASVEARYPFLDREVVSLATRIPPQVVMRGGVGEAVLRAAARGHLPAQIVQRDKMGFHAPGTPTLLEAARPWVEDTLSPARLRRLGIFDPGAVQHLMGVYGRPGFRLDLPLQDDLLMIVLSCAVLMDEFKMSL